MPDQLFDISGRVALVTGGSRGIGLMIARGYVAAGARVYIVSRNAGFSRFSINRPPAAYLGGMQLAKEFPPAG